MEWLGSIEFSRGAKEKSKFSRGESDRRLEDVSEDTVQQPATAPTPDEVAENERSANIYYDTVPITFPCTTMKVTSYTGPGTPHCTFFLSLSLGI